MGRVGAGAQRVPMTCVRARLHRTLTPASADGSSAPLVNTRSAHEGFGAPAPDAQQVCVCARACMCARA